MRFTCCICNQEGAHPTYKAKEQMLGWGDEFLYFQCITCGCLQISEVPADLERFYPTNYYSYRVLPVPQKGLRAFLGGLRDAQILKGFPSRTFWHSVSRVRLDLDCLSRIGLKRDLKILDVGCGRGQLLSVLLRAGFTELMGIDPYLENNLEVAPGLTVFKMEVEAITVTFDLIMLHHVFEHIEDGAQMLASLRSKLNPKGRILIRIPVADSFAWESYKENWVQLDAPRHLRIYTRKGLELISTRAGLKIDQYWCDSSEFQFVGSELYKKGIPLIGSSTSAYFTENEITLFRKKSRQLNDALKGDQIAAVLVAEK